MNIKYCPIDGGNFGDTLNTLVWNRLFPDLMRLQHGIVVYGIGTLLDGRHDETLRKVVLGSGLGESGAAKADPNWDFRWVRGPLSAQAFGISPQLALGDSALLWHDLPVGCGGTHDGPIGLIPHYRTWDSFDWEMVAASAGLVAINPRQSPQAVISQLRACSLVLAESLHGAICADAMAIPWAPCILAHRFNEFKWKDWLATIQRPFEPLIADRPLIRTIGRTKALMNRFARTVRYKEHTRRPSLRPIGSSTTADAGRVAQQIADYVRCSHHFACSDPVAVAIQREQMMSACESFALEYGLQFNSAAPYING